MKKDYRPEEMRETAEAIRTAVMPKSITPDMVGGTMLGILNALGEVVEVLGEIPREHVTVKVRGYDGESEVSAAGAIVCVDMFSIGGYPTIAIPRQEFTANEDGVVEFDVPYGYKYALFSKIAGLGVSFQLVYDALAETRKINLWNFPIGVWALGHTDLANYDIDIYKAVPFITDGYMEEIPEEIALWAQDEEHPNHEGWWYVGILVSTADTTFAIAQNNLSEKTMQWCDSHDRTTLFPLLNYFAERRYDQPWDWDASVEQARTDFDGNMNTAKILAFSPTHIAARSAVSQPADYDEQRFLPSAGQLYIMTLNREAINKLAQEFNNDGWEFALLPYPNEKGQWQYPNENEGDWWSSSVLDKTCSWVVDTDGSIYYLNRTYNYSVRAVSAFHFEY